MGEELGTDFFLDELIRQVSQTLPKINRQMSTGVISLDDWVVSVMPFVDQINHYIFKDATSKILQLGMVQARSFLQLLGFIISSAEHHFQSSNFKPGTGLKRLASVEQLCLALSTISFHPPRDTIYSYCIWNTSDEPLTFTGDDQEVLFIRVTNEIDRLYTIADDKLRKICMGLVRIDSPVAGEILQSSAEDVWQARKTLWSILEYRDELHSARGIEPMFFMKELRTYWPTFPLGGEIWGGASSANLASQIRLDHLIGTVDQKYTEHILSRKMYFPVESWDALRNDLLLPSITELLIEHIGLSMTNFESLSDDHVTDIISRQPVGLQSIFMSFRNLVNASGNVTSIHWALVQNYVVKPSQELSIGEVEHLSVRPDIGSSGLSINDIASIRDLRRKHPIANKLCRCLPKM
jgi:hypothetical protein